MNTHGIFITGTGTEVGKTVITAGLLRLCRQNGIDAVPMKPVQTGCAETPQGLLAPDLQFSLEAGKLVMPDAEAQLASPYRFLPACSPHLAARMAGRQIKIKEIQSAASALLLKHELLLVEGAGGIMVPLDESHTMLDLMKALKFPVLLVAHCGLGTINHTLLSLEILRQAGLEILGVVFNTSSPISQGNEFIHHDNPKTISSFGKIEIMGTLRYFPELSAAGDRMWMLFNEDLPGLTKIVSETINHD